MKEEEITLAIIKKILSSGELDGFVGYAENAFFEAKSCKPWTLDATNDPELLYARSELAKDIGCIANKNEGYIILGLKTPDNKGKTADRDYVVERIAFKKEDFYDKDLLMKCLKGFIYPEPLLEIEWYPSKTNQDEGLGVIHILPGNKNLKYFITPVNIDEEGVVIKHYFGIPKRDGDKPGWFKEKEVYGLVRERPNDWQESHTRIMGKLENIEEKIGQRNPEAEYDPMSDLEEKMKEVTDDQQ